MSVRHRDLVIVAAKFAQVTRRRRRHGPKQDIDRSTLSMEFKKSIGFIGDNALNYKAKEFFQNEIPFDKEPCHKTDQEINDHLRLSRRRQPERDDRRPARPATAAARFTTVAGERGAADAARDIRGFAVKFYTEEGSWDN